MTFSELIPVPKSSAISSVSLKEAAPNAERRSRGRSVRGHSVKLVMV